MELVTTIKDHSTAHAMLDSEEMVLIAQVHMFELYRQAIGCNLLIVHFRYMAECKKEVKCYGQLLHVFDALLVESMCCIRSKLMKWCYLIRQIHQTKFSSHKIFLHTKFLPQNQNFVNFV